VILCPQALDLFLLVHGFPLTKEVTSEHLLQRFVQERLPAPDTTRGSWK
jgi:hypothetical protein